jgi:peptidoglycan/LPS O-acetylase OafA/YrhL
VSPAVAGAGGARVRSDGVVTDAVRPPKEWIALGVWALACGALVALMVVARRRLGARRAWLAPLVAVPIAVVLVYFLFGAVNALLPASY